MTIIKAGTQTKLFGSKIIIFDGPIKDLKTGAVEATIGRIGHTTGNIQVAHRFLKLSPARQLFVITMLKEFLELYNRNDLTYFEKHILADSLGFRKMMRKYPKTKKGPFLKFFQEELAFGPKDLSSYRIENFIHK